MRNWTQVIRCQSGGVSFLGGGVCAGAAILAVGVGPAPGLRAACWWLEIPLGCSERIYCAVAYKWIAGKLEWRVESWTTRDLLVSCRVT